MMNCVEFLMGHPGFQYNQIYKPCHIYNQNRHRVYNEMYTEDWYWKQQMEYSPRTTIIPILLLSNKTVMSLYYRDHILWSVYITIGYLDSKTWQSQTQLGTLLLDSILIVHERSEDRDNKDKDLKAKIYHLAFKTIL